MSTNVHIYIYIFRCIHICISPPLCLLHAWRVVRTAVPYQVPESLLDLHASAGSPSRIPAESARQPDTFRKELNESQFFQRCRYRGNPENATNIKRNILFWPNVLLSRGPPEIQPKSNMNSTAQAFPKKLPADLQRKVRRIPTWTQNLPKTSEIEAQSRSWKGIRKKQTENNKYVQSLYFRNIRALPKTDFFYEKLDHTLVLEPLEGISKNTCKMMPLLQK